MRKIITPILLIVFLAIVAVTLPAACSEPAASGTSVSISLADREVSAGEVFTVEVCLRTDVPCRGAQFALDFDPAIMRCDSVTEGGFFKEWAEANGAVALMFPQSPTIDNVEGSVATIGIAIMGGSEGGAKGSGALSTYYFTALADGIAGLELSEVAVSDESGQTIPDVEVEN